MLALKYEQVDFKKSFDVFRKKIVNYTETELKNAKDVLKLVQDMKYPKGYFDTKNDPKYLNEADSKS